MKTATPQDTFDHMIGSGALSYEWWHAVDVNGVKANGYDAEDDWSAVISADNGDGGEATATINHALVLKTARAIIKDHPQYASDALIRESRHLIFNADETDFDACSADEFLQIMVLGEIVFG